MVLRIKFDPSNWHIRPCVLWSLLTAQHFSSLASALQPRGSFCRITHSPGSSHQALSRAAPQPAHNSLPSPSLLLCPGNYCQTLSSFSTYLLKEEALLGTNHTPSSCLNFLSSPYQVPPARQEIRHCWVRGGGAIRVNSAVSGNRGVHTHLAQSYAVSPWESESCKSPMLPSFTRLVFASDIAWCRSPLHPPTPLTELRPL